jgi:hypothetical protein
MWNDRSEYARDSFQKENRDMISNKENSVFNDHQLEGLSNELEGDLIVSQVEKYKGKGGRCGIKGGEIR